MRNMIVTGGAGFIGSNFIDYMLEKYPDLVIYNIDKLSYASNTKNLPNGVTRDRHNLVVADLVRMYEDSWLPWFEEHEPVAVVHFAAETHVDNSIKDPLSFVKNNVIGTVNLLEILKKMKKKPLLVHVSTDEVYGTLSLCEGPEFKQSWIELDPYEPNSPYAASKASSDHFVRAYGNTYQIPYVITNCGNNYGPRQHLEKFIPKAVTNLLQGKKVPVYGTGLNVRDWIYVTDHCSAIDTIIQKGIVGEKYNIGGDGALFNNVEITELIIATVCMDAMFNPKPILFDLKHCIEYVTDRPGHDLKYCLDNSKLKELGWRPEVMLHEGLRMTVEWYEKMRGSWWDVK